jgi:hypothetical protein
MLRISSNVSSESTMLLIRNLKIYGSCDGGKGVDEDIWTKGYGCMGINYMEV